MNGVISAIGNFIRGISNKILIFIADKGILVSKTASTILSILILLIPIYLSIKFSSRMNKYLGWLIIGLSAFFIISVLISTFSKV